MEKFAHELLPGDHCEPLEVIVTPELNQQYLFSQEDFDPRYVNATNAGPPLVHPTFLAQISANTKSPSFRLAPGSGSILAEETIDAVHLRIGAGLDDHRQLAHLLIA